MFYLLNDHLGSVNVVTDHSGAFVQRLAWNPYGELRQAEGQSFSAAFPFAGALRDPGLGLDDFGARFYDPRFGRFLSLDPLMIDPLDLDVQNPYAYAKWNPMSYVDVGGLHHGEKSGWALFVSTSWGGALYASGGGANVHVGVQYGNLIAGFQVWSSADSTMALVAVNDRARFANVCPPSRNSSLDQAINRWSKSLLPDAA